MRKFLFFTLCLALFVTSCKKNEDETPAPTPEEQVCDSPNSFASATIDNEVFLSWSNTGALSYKVYRNDVVIASGITDTTYTEIVPFGEYAYQIQAVCNYGESPKTGELYIIVVNPWYGNYAGEIGLNGQVNVNFGGINVPIEQTLSDMTMSITETDNPNKVKIVLTTSSGRTIECDGNIDGYDLTVPSFKLESITLPFEYNGMTLELELDITISDVAANYSENEINGTGKAIGTSKIELFGQSISTDLDIDLDIHFTEVER
ncbi:MAG: hypothetical protein ACI358_07635 [Candidatus Limimorpha sp.]